MLSGSGSGGHWEWQVVSQDKYIDKYYEENLSEQTKTHVYLNDIKIASVNNNSNPQYILSDHLSSSNIVVDSSGTVMESTDYKPYGSIQAEYTTTDPLYDYKFLGKEVDEEDQLQYFLARYYDNQVSRFSSVDPVLLILQNKDKLANIIDGDINKVLSNPQQLNSYAYAINNPLVMEDQTGQFSGEFGRFMANGQRGIASFFHKAGNYTSSKGGIINKTAGFVANAVGDFYDSTANIYDPDQKAGIRLFALGMVAMDASTGGEGKVVFKGLKNLPQAVSATEKLNSLSKIFNKSATEILDEAASRGVGYIDNANKGNINVLIPKPDQSQDFIRVTLDPAMQKIISAGHVRQNSLIKYIENGRFTPLK